jgi:hypothetical protein
VPDDIIIVSGSKVAPSRGDPSRVLRARILYMGICFSGIEKNNIKTRLFVFSVNNK